MVRYIWLACITVASTQFSSGQSAEEVLNKYHEAKQAIETISYRVQRIDSFPSGNVWNNQGYCVMKRHDEDSVFGYLFKAKRDDVNSEIVFNGSDYYLINHADKTYRIEHDIHRGILGSPGGQMVFTDFLKIEEPFTSLKLIKTDSCLILKFDYRDDTEYKIEKRHRKIYLDSKTYLPLYSYQHAERAGQESVSISKLSNVVINGDEDPFVNKDYLKNYSGEKTSNEATVPLRKLINTEAPDFELTAIDGKKFKLSDYRNKVVILDFWEIWCSPCIKSLPKVKELASKYANGGIEFWSIVSDAKTFGKVKNFVHREQLDYPVLFGTRQTSKDYFVYGVPRYVLIDKRGIIRFVKDGFNDELEASIKEHL